MNKLEEVIIYTDGSVGNNIIGYAYFIERKKETLLGYGYIEGNLNSNEAEFIAIIEALKKIEKKSQIEIYTDSMNLIRIFNEGLVTKSIHLKYWAEFINLSLKHSISFFWIKGHRNCEQHNLCDTYAREARTQLVSGFRKHKIKKLKTKDHKIRLSFKDTYIAMKKPNNKVVKIRLPQNIVNISIPKDKEYESIIYALKTLKKRKNFNFNVENKENFLILKKIKEEEINVNSLSDKERRLFEALKYKNFTCNLLKKS